MGRLDSSRRPTNEIDVLALCAVGECAVVRRSARHTLPAAAGTKAAEQELLTLSRDKWRWMAERNVESLNALFHDEAVFVHMGATMSKAQELDVVSEPEASSIRAPTSRRLRSRFIGTTAILLNRIRLTAVVGGNEVINPFVVTEVYVQQGGAWKLGSLSFTRLLTP